MGTTSRDERRRVATEIVGSYAFLLLVVLVAGRCDVATSFVRTPLPFVHDGRVVSSSSSSSARSVSSSRPTPDGVRPTPSTTDDDEQQQQQQQQQQERRFVEDSWSRMGSEDEDDAWTMESVVNDARETRNAVAPSREAVVGPDEVLVYDTTLRDGTQGESVSLSCDDKLRIASRLVEFGVDYVEAGWPGSNPKDAEFFARAATELDDVVRSRLVAFGSTRRKGVAAEDDAQLAALLESGAPTLCLVAKAHAWQVTDVLRAGLDENLDMISESVRFLTSRGRRVYVDLEHFFDGFAHDEDYSLACCRAAADAGAVGLVLCDTNGGGMPWDVERTTRSVRGRTRPDVVIGVHAHNDRGTAVANSLSAVRAGAALVQGTINGIGERTGNADLCSVVPSLALHLGSRMTCRDRLDRITKLSRFVDETLNRNPDPAAPYVGASAFAHKGGLHVAAMERSPLSYQHIDPQLVGNEKRVLVSELSGRQNIIGKIEELGIEFGDETSERAVAVLERVKVLESLGYSFEGADASVRLMIMHASDDYCAPFRVLDYCCQVFDTDMTHESRILFKGVVDGEWSAANRRPTARATIKVRTVDGGAVDDDDDGPRTASPYVERLEVADGAGPIEALASALRRCIVPHHRDVLETVELVDYKVRIVDPERATAASTRVMVEFRDARADERWTTVSVDANVVTASLNALVDGFEYALLKSADQDTCVLWDL